MLWCVFEHPLPHVVVLDAVDWCGLEPPPAKGDDEGVASFEDPLVPAMLLQPHPDVAETPLPWLDSTHYHRVVGIKVLHKFTRHSYKHIRIHNVQVKAKGALVYTVWLLSTQTRVNVKASSMLS